MLADPVPALKRQLAHELKTLLERYNPCFAGPVIGIDEARMSQINNGRLERFSLQKLVRLLARIDRRVTMQIVVEGSGDFQVSRLHGGPRRTARKTPISVAPPRLSREPGAARPR